MFQDIYKNKFGGKKMKKLTAMLLSAVLVLSLFTGCNVKTKDDVKGPDAAQPSTSGGTDNAVDGREPISITLLSLSSLETETNVVRDQLKKAGFDVTLSILDSSTIFLLNPKLLMVRQIGAKYALSSTT